MSLLSKNYNPDILIGDAYDVSVQDFRVEVIVNRRVLDGQAAADVSSHVVNYEDTEEKSFIKGLPLSVFNVDSMERYGYMMESTELSNGNLIFKLTPLYSKPNEPTLYKIVRLTAKK